MDEFLSMNGYGFYIWWAYGLTGLILLLMLGSTLLKNRKLKRQIIETDTEQL